MSRSIFASDAPCESISVAPPPPPSLFALCCNDSDATLDDDEEDEEEEVVGAGSGNETKMGKGEVEKAVEELLEVEDELVVEEADHEDKDEEEPYKIEGDEINKGDEGGDPEVDGWDNGKKLAVGGEKVREDVVVDGNEVEKNVGGWEMEVATALSWFCQGVPRNAWETTSCSSRRLTNSS